MAEQAFIMTGSEVQARQTLDRLSPPRPQDSMRPARNVPRAPLRRRGGS